MTEDTRPRPTPNPVIRFAKVGDTLNVDSCVNGFRLTCSGSTGSSMWRHPDGNTVSNPADSYVFNDPAKLGEFVAAWAGAPSTAADVQDASGMSERIVRSTLDPARFVDCNVAHGGGLGVAVEIGPSERTGIILDRHAALRLAARLTYLANRP